MEQPGEPPLVPYGPPPGLDLSAFGNDAPAVVLPAPGSVERLAPGPRPVPAEYRLACFDVKVVELVWFAGILAALAPLSGTRVGMPVVLTVGLAGVLAYRQRRSRLRLALLRWGEVATVTGFEELTGARYSGTSYGNARLRSARGWRLDRSAYSGRGFTTDVAYTLNGVVGTVRVRGRRYDGDVVLADARDPLRAACVRECPHDLTPGPDGQWPGGLPTTVWVGVLVTLLLEASLVGGTVASWVGLLS